MLICHRTIFLTQTTDNWQLKSFSRLAKASLIHCVCIQLYIINFNDIVFFMLLFLFLFGSIQFSSVRFGSERVKLCVPYGVCDMLQLHLDFSYIFTENCLTDFHTIYNCICQLKQLFVFQCAFFVSFVCFPSMHQMPRVCKLIGA